MNQIKEKLALAAGHTWLTIGWFTALGGAGVWMASNDYEIPYSPFVLTAGFYLALSAFSAFGLAGYAFYLIIAEGWHRWRIRRSDD